MYCSTAVQTMSDTWQNSPKQNSKPKDEKSEPQKCAWIHFYLFYFCTFFCCNLSFVACDLLATVQLYFKCAWNKRNAPIVPIFSSKTVLLLLSFDTKFAWTNSKYTRIYFFYISAKFCNWDHIKIFIFQCVPVKVRLFIVEKVSVYKSEYLIVFFPSFACWMAK